MTDSMTSGEQGEGEHAVLVVSLGRSADGVWRVTVNDTVHTTTVDLAPLLVVIRLWKQRRTGIIRGTIEHPASSRRAPFQSNTQLETVIDALVGRDAIS